MGCVYIATNGVTGKVYIGKTVQELRKRKNIHHFYARRGSKKFFYFQRAIEKYGKDAFSWEILFQSNDDKVLCQRETLFIAAYDSQNPERGYNLCSGGEGSIPNEETKAKIREAVRSYATREEVRAFRREAINKRLSDPVFRKKHSDSVRAACGKPEWQEKHKRVLEYIHSDPDILAKVVQSNKQKAKDPEWIKANQKSLDAAHDAAVRPVICIETGIIYHGTLDANRRLGVNPSVVTSCCRGVKKHGKGFRWRYASDDECEKYGALRKKIGVKENITVYDLDH
jgi:group I intron endonuclease